jgi:hypothetical protein
MTEGFSYIYLASLVRNFRRISYLSVENESDERSAVSSANSRACEKAQGAGSEACETQDTLYHSISVDDPALIPLVGRPYWQDEIDTKSM